MKKYSWVINYSLLALLTLAIYWQGLTSGFFLDDMPNLSSMGSHLSLGYWENLFIFLLEGRSGPTGRPLSLVTFYLNASTFPADPWSFKLTNVVIHIINGALLTLILHKLTRLIKMQAQQAKWLILLSVGFWLLHPFQITTVLYAIQRMTELSALFMLLGMLSYIYGREWLIDNEQPQLKSFLLLSILVWVNLLLAMLSKETGLLLLAYIVIIEYFFLRPFAVKTSNTLKQWVFYIAFIPFIAVLTYIYWAGLSPHAYDFRPFSLEQRLLTETRIIFDYLANILIPGFSTPSLYHDGHTLSTGWLQPWSTLTSVIGLVLLIATGWLSRNKYPVLSFGIFWFLGSHLIESTVVALELYFEHRNYLAMFGPLFVLVYYTQTLLIANTKLHKAGYAFLSIFALMIMANTVQNVMLWKNPIALVSTWVKENPNSLRAIETLDTFEKQYGVTLQDKELRQLIQTINIQQEEPLFLLLRELKFSCANGTLEKEALQKAQNKFSSLVNEHRIPSSEELRGFINEWKAGKCSDISPQQMISLLNDLLDIPKAQHGDLKYIAYLGLSKAWEKERNLDQTLHFLTKAYNKKPTLGLVFRKVNFFLSAGLYDEANATLDDLSRLKTTFRKQLVIKIREKEIISMRHKILQTSRVRPTHQNNLSNND